LYWEEGEFEACDPAADAGRGDKALTSETRTGDDDRVLPVVPAGVD